MWCRRRVLPPLDRSRITSRMRIAKNFQPANITFDLLPPLEKKIRDRKERHRLQCELALREFDGWLETINVSPARV